MTTQTAGVHGTSPSLAAGITRDPDLIIQAQQLRYQVFSAEYDSDLGSDTPGLDADRFDPLCDHLIVTSQRTGIPVATTRILPAERVPSLESLYCAGEFDLAAFARLPGSLAELGRTCVHPDYRNGATLALLWSTLAEYLLRHRIDYLIGCASISMADGGLRAWRIATHLQQTCLSDTGLRVRPKRELPHLTDTAPADPPVTIPPLIRTYMRLGARICGAPCWDPEFRCADLLVLLEVDKLSARYRRHFMKPVS